MGPQRDVTKLIESHQGYAHAIAAEVLRKMPPEIDRNELEAAAELGLVEAANAYDPARGVQFKTFSYYRIRGAVYDGLRKMGWFSKTQYQEMKFQAAANEYMADQTEAPAARGATPEQQWGELTNIAGAVVNCYMLSLDSLKQEWADGQAVAADERLARKQQSSQLRQALERLPEKNRQLMEAYYFGEQNLEQIGVSLGLSKSWVCRMHAKSLEMLRELMEEGARPAIRRERATFEQQLR